MKTLRAIIPFILVSAFAIGQLHSISLNNRDTSKTLYKYDYRKCLFTIEVGDWTTHQGKNVLPVTTTLNNISDDTLKYETMTHRIFSYAIKSKELEYEDPNSDVSKNIPEMYKIPPYQSSTFLINVMKKDGEPDHKGKLKMEFCLITPRFINSNPFDDGSLGLFWRIDDKGKRIKLSNDEKKAANELKKRTHWIHSNIVTIDSI